MTCNFSLSKTKFHSLILRVAERNGTKIEYGLGRCLYQTLTNVDCNWVGLFSTGKIFRDGLYSTRIALRCVCRLAVSYPQTLNIKSYETRALSFPTSPEKPFNKSSGENMI